MMAFMAVIMGVGLLFHVLLGFRYRTSVLGFRVAVSGLRVSGLQGSAGPKESLRGLL